MDLYIFARLPFACVRVHVMIADPRFGNFLSISKHPRNDILDLLHISCYFNHKEIHRPCVSGYDHSWKLLCIPSLLNKLRHLQWIKRQRLECKNTTGLGALFG